MESTYEFENDISDDAKSIKQIRQRGFMVKNSRLQPALA